MFAKYLGLHAHRKLADVRSNRAAFILGFFVIFAFSCLMLLFEPLYFGEISGELGLEIGKIKSYILLGAAYLPLYSLAIWDAAEHLQQEVSTRQIDYTLASPLKLPQYIYAAIVGGGWLGILNFMIISLLGIILNPDLLVFYHIPVFVFLSAVSVFSLTVWGFAFSLLIVIKPRFQAVFQVINLCFQFLTGVMLPVVVLPGAIMHLALLFPITAPLELVRYYVLGTELVFPAWVLFLVCGLHLIVGSVLSVRIFSSFERHLRS